MLYNRTLQYIMKSKLFKSPVIWNAPAVNREISMKTCGTNTRNEWISIEVTINSYWDGE